MKEIEITALSKAADKGGVEHTVNFQMPETTKEAVETYGEEVVYSRFLSAMKVDIQAFIRQKVNLENPVVGKALQNAMDEYQPGVRKQSASRIESLKERLAKLSPEERAALFEGLTGGPPRARTGDTSAQANRQAAAQKPALKKVAGGRR